MFANETDSHEWIIRKISKSIAPYLCCFGDRNGSQVWKHVIRTVVWNQTFLVGTTPSKGSLLQVSWLQNEWYSHYDLFYHQSCCWFHILSIHYSCGLTSPIYAYDWSWRWRTPQLHWCFHFKDALDQNYRIDSHQVTSIISWTYTIQSKTISQLPILTHTIHQHPRNLYYTPLLPVKSRGIPSMLPWISPNMVA
jgi:hypothetical protein